MKKCQSCGETKPLDEFHNQTKSKDGKQSRCKACNLEQRKQYYKTAHGRARNVLTGKRWGEQMMFKVFEYLKEHPCVDCGESDPIVLEFDHRDNVVKVANISAMIKHYGWAKIEEEIAKCDVRCANCHRRRTAKQFNWAALNW